MLCRWVARSLLFVAALLAAGAAGDADFQSVRTGLLKDYSGKAGDAKEKFFRTLQLLPPYRWSMQFETSSRGQVGKLTPHVPLADESTFHPHYDGRFTDRQLNAAERRPTLVAMIQAYLSTMADLGAETWVMNGTLLGWWWNRQILPWDSDLDVQVTLDTLAFLHNFYQLQVFHYRPPGADAADDETGNSGHNYMLEINPDFHHKTKWDHLNSIDARWIDMKTGVFIDITALRPNETARARGQPEALECKDNHKYNESDIFPLRDSHFEGVPTKIPYDYAWLLEEEYTKDALTRTEFEK